MKSPWFQIRKPNARLRVICFPSAGGGGVEFLKYQRHLPEGVAICPALLPGRERRLAEPALESMAPLIAGLADGLRPALDRPFAFLGHSMGSWVAFELTRELRRRGGPQPVHLLLSGRRAPHLPERHTFHGSTDEEFLTWLQGVYGAMPPELLQNPMLLELFLPTLRADVGLLGRYEYTEQEPLDVPISMLSGSEDKSVTAAEIAGWSRHTSSSFDFQMMPGGHFFLRDSPEDYAAVVGDRLQPYCD